MSTTPARTALVEQLAKVQFTLKQLDESMGGIAPDEFPYDAQLDALQVTDWAQELLNEANRMMLAARTFQMAADAAARAADAAKKAAAL